MRTSRRPIFVSVIIPTRNERRFIDKCIEGFLHQTYPRDHFELVIADKSDDGTEELLREYAKSHPTWLRLFANPTGTIAGGYNVALNNAKGDIIATYIGHAYPDLTYVERIVHAVTEEDVDLVGGKVVPLESMNSEATRAIALALKSPFAVGRNAFTRDVRCEIVSTHWMATKRAWVDKAGEFDTRLVRGEDCDWYERMIALGAKSFFYPDIVSYYYPRDTYSKQCGIQILNAWHRFRLYFMTGRGMRFRHIVPILSTIIFLFVSLMVIQSLSLALLPFLVYGIVLTWASALISKSLDRNSMRVMLAIFCIHLGHLLGMLGGIMVYGLRSLPRLLRIGHAFD